MIETTRMETANGHDVTGDVRHLRTRATTSDHTRVLLIIGCVALPLGFALVGLGWYGASRTTVVSEQIPYEISGGLLGLGFVVAGGFAYFSYWLTQLVQVSRTAAADTREILEELRALRTPTPERDASPFVATVAGTMFHERECPVVAGSVNLRAVNGSEPDLVPCGICHPTPRQ